MMEVRVVEHLRKNFFRKDVLDQHFAYVGGGDAWVDCILCVLEEAQRGLAEVIFVALGCLDHVAQCLEHIRQIGLELLDRLAKIRDLLTLVAEEQLQQVLQLGGVLNSAAKHFLPVLD
jgi:hypothetical protein